MASVELRDVLDSPDVDAVLLCTPTQLHAAQSIATLEAGKHVMVDIPLADSWRTRKRWHAWRARRTASAWSATHDASTLRTNGFTSARSGAATSSRWTSRRISSGAPTPTRSVGRAVGRTISCGSRRPHGRPLRLPVWRADRGGQRARRTDASRPRDPHGYVDSAQESKRRTALYRSVSTTRTLAPFFATSATTVRISRATTTSRPATMSRSTSLRSRSRSTASNYRTESSSGPSPSTISPTRPSPRCWTATRSWATCRRS